jgi:GNAT superfamily N-acetyltransferase
MKSDNSVQVSVRLASAGDAERLAVLSGQLGYPATSEEVRRRLRRLQQDGDHAVFVAELPNGHIVGWAHVYLRQLLIVALRAEIGGLVVDEEVRGCGIGRLLMRQVEGWARERGCEAVSLRSNVVRERAHVFYQQLGYENTKKSLTFCKTLRASSVEDFDDATPSC